MATTRRAVLLAEDDPNVRSLVADTLRLEGYEVIEASNPSEALALARRHADTIGMLITDLVMPELNGPQLAEILRSSQPEIKVLFMSGYGEESSVVSGLEGMKGQLLHKPFSPDELARRVHAALAREPGP
jgi:two-component system, cell cycle sensor histidine kinase and response regulator CckA